MSASVHVALRSVGSTLAFHVSAGSSTTVTVAPPPSTKGWVTWTHGKKAPAPAVYDAGSDSYVAKWPLVDSAETDELGNAESTFVINKDGTKLTTKTPGPKITQEFLIAINGYHRKAKEEKEKLKTIESDLTAARKQLAAAKKRLAAAQTDQERTEAEFDLSNAEGSVEIQETIRKQAEQAAAQFQAMVTAGIEEVRLHEETHLNLAAKVADTANQLLPKEKSPVLRQRIIDSAFDINEAVDATMDGLLNNQDPLGSQANLERLEKWITPRAKKDAAEQSEQDYHSEIAEAFEKEPWKAEP